MQFIYTFKRAIQLHEQSKITIALEFDYSPN